MNVLYFSELFPIRENPYEYYEVAKNFSKVISQQTLNSRLVCNDEIYKRLYANDLIATPQRLPLSSELKRWIATNRATWNDAAIDNWLNYVRGQSSEPLATYLYQLKQTVFDYDVIVVWGKNDTIKNLAQELGVKVVYLELTPSRKPYYEGIFISDTGVNGDFKSGSYTHQNVLAPKTPKTKEQVLVALQLYDDLNFQLYSPFSSIIDFIDYVAANFPDEFYDVYVKRHPLSVQRPINWFHESRAIEHASSTHLQILETHDERFLDSFDVVVTINSSVGFEAAVLGKQVYVIGDACYKHDVMTFSHSSSESAPLDLDVQKRMTESFIDSHFFQWSELESYLQNKYPSIESKPTNHILLTRPLSYYIGKKVSFSDNYTTIDGLVVKHDLSCELKFNEQKLEVAVTCANGCSPMFLFETLDERILSGAVVGSNNSKFKARSANSRFILIGYSQSVIGKI